MLRAISHAHEATAEPFGSVVLDSSERHLRRKVITTDQGDKVMVDLPEAVLFSDGDVLMLEDGRTIAIIAAREKLYEIKSSGAAPLSHLAWHLGNRHLAAQIEPERILIQRDHVIRAMLLGLGATVAEVIEPFQPVHGAYHHHDHDHVHAHGHGHGHDHHDHGHAHEHSYGEKSQGNDTDLGKRSQSGHHPGDPHDGHDHG